MNLLKADTPFPLAHWSLGHQSHRLPNPHIFGAYTFGAGARGWGIPTSCSSGTSSELVRCLPIVCYFTGSEVYGQTMSFPLLPISVWSFYPLLWRSSSSILQIYFSERIDAYAAIGLVCLRRVQDLPTLPSGRNL